MNTKIVAGLSIFILLPGIASMSGHFAEARSQLDENGKPIHNFKLHQKDREGNQENKHDEKKEILQSYPHDVKNKQCRHYNYDKYNKYCDQYS